MSKPAPSLPVFGSDWPPVARTTALADRSPVEVVTMKSPFADVARATSSTRRPDSSVAPTRSVSRSSASSTSRDRLVSGNSLPPASSWRLTPISRKNATAALDGNARRMRRTIDERPPQKSASVTCAFVTLQRDPPLTRIFAPGFLAPSRSTTDRPGLARRAKMAVARPAAPAPTMTMSAMPYVTRRARRARGAGGRRRFPERWRRAVPCRGPVGQRRAVSRVVDCLFAAAFLVDRRADAPERGRRGDVDLKLLERPNG